MPFDSVLSPHISFAVQANSFYRELVSFVGPNDPDAEPGLGGKLLFIGELDATGRALVVAGNVAGAASLATTADRDGQKQAVRDGIVDFLVTSLDEALRILKNEIRKSNTVAVCVASRLIDVEHEMHERGVQADIWRGTMIANTSSRDARGQQKSNAVSKPHEQDALISWTVSSAPARWLPKLDQLALDCVETHDWPARRWLRLAPRYMGRLLTARLLKCDRIFATRFVERVHERVGHGEIASEVHIQVSIGDQVEDHRFVPSSHREAEG